MIREPSTIKRALLRQVIRLAPGERRRDSLPVLVSLTVAVLLLGVAAAQALARLGW